LKTTQIYRPFAAASEVFPPDTFNSGKPPPPLSPHTHVLLSTCNMLVPLFIFQRRLAISRLRVPNRINRNREGNTWGKRGVDLSGFQKNRRGKKWRIYIYMGREREREERGGKEKERER